jgi:hypothetical protein
MQGMASCDVKIKDIHKQNKFNTNEALEKFKIHLKQKLFKVNILLCQMILMPIVWPTLKIDVLKMEQAFQMGYMEGEKAFFILHTNWQGQKESMLTFEGSCDPFWMKKNAKFGKFGKFFLVDPNHYKFFGKIFYVGMATIGFKPSCLTLTRFILIRRIGTFV